jgi:hypothetical protein
MVVQDSLALIDPLDRQSLSAFQRNLLGARLTQLRKATESDPRLLNWQQSNVQLAMAYTLGLAPQPRELSPWLRPTKFFQEHSTEIYEVAKEKLTSAWLDSFAEPKVQFEQSMRCQSWIEREQPERLRLQPQLRELAGRWLSENSEFETLQKRYHELIEQQREEIGPGKGLAYSTWVKEHPEYREVQLERYRRMNLLTLAEERLLAERLGGARPDCATKWICICDRAVSAVCYEGAGVQRTGLITYMDRSTHEWEQLPCLDLVWVDARGRVLITIEQLSDAEFLASDAAKRGYPKFLCCPELLPERLEILRRYLERLQTLPEFGPAAVAIMRNSENDVRASYGVAVLRRPARGINAHSNSDSKRP